MSSHRPPMARLLDPIDSPAVLASSNPSGSDDSTMSSQREQAKRTDSLASEILLPHGDSEETATLSPQEISNGQVGGSWGRAKKKARTDGRNNQTKNGATKDSKESNGAAAAAAAAAGDRKYLPSPSTQENMSGSESPSFQRRVPTQRLGERAIHKSSNAPNGLIASDRGARMEDAALERPDGDKSVGPPPHDASALLAASTSSRCRTTGPPEEKHRATSSRCSSGETPESAKPGQPSAAPAAAESPESALPSMDNVGMDIRGSSGEKAAENANVESPAKPVVDGGENHDDDDLVDAAKDLLPLGNTRQEPAVLPANGPNDDSPVEQTDGSSMMEAEAAATAETEVENCAGEKYPSSTLPTKIAQGDAEEVDMPGKNAVDHADECNSLAEENVSNGRVSPSEEPEPVVVRCGKRASQSLPEYKRYVADLDAKRVEYLNTKLHSVEREAIFRHFLARYLLVRDDTSKPFTEEEVKIKISKNLSDRRKLPEQSRGRSNSEKKSRKKLEDVASPNDEELSSRPRRACTAKTNSGMKASLGDNSSAEENGSECRESPSEGPSFEPGPVVVQCGGRVCSLDGNRVFLRDVKVKRAEYLEAEPKSDERAMVLDHFLSQYRFVHSGISKPFTEKEARGHVIRALHNNQKQPVVGAQNGQVGTGPSRPRRAGSAKANSGMDSLGTSSGEDNDSDGRESANEGPEPILVHCGRGLRGKRNKRYLADLNDKRAEFRNSKPQSVEREAIFRHFLALYTFVRDGSDEPITEKAAREKLSKSLGDARLLANTSAPKQFRGQPKSEKRKRGHPKLAGVNSKRARSSTDVSSSASDQCPGPQEEHGTAPPKPAPKKESKYLHNFLHQPYTEELAFHYYANVPEPFAENPDEPGLDPLPPPLDPPELPEGTEVKWEYASEDRRVILVDFTGVDRHQISVETKRSLGEMMQRDDLALIFQGLCEGMNEEDVLQQIKYEFSNGKPYHKFRRFDKTVSADGSVSFVERDGFVDMPGEDFLKYLELAHAANQSDATQPTGLFSFHDSNGTKQTVDPSQVVFYMTDVDIPKLLPELNDYYLEIFKMKEILPGGTWCMMNRCASNSRPFVGPNLYVTPGGGFTQLHQDGHGTVDSGHTCISGFNEVVMLRRLPELHKKNACRMMPSLEGRRSSKQAENILYKRPHDDGREDKPIWPKTSTIREMENANYCPHVFILQPGQHLHIPKGCLHAFRKLRTDRLPPDDCHAVLREEIVESSGLRQTGNPTCVSIAYDWTFMGITDEGINRENASVLECSALCRPYDNAKPLSISGYATIRQASLIPKIGSSAPSSTPSTSLSKTSFKPDLVQVARGLLPSLRYIQARDDRDIKDVLPDASTLGARAKLAKHVSLTTDNVPDSHNDTEVASIDPYGNDGYSCRICGQELSNVYFHCNGCETILAKDYNICGQCFGEGKFLQFDQMHKLDGKRCSDQNHTGDLELDLPPKTCRCHQGNCKNCQEPGKKGRRWCKMCSCHCHQKFTRKYRFYTPEDVHEFVANCQEFAQGEVKYATETVARLKGEVMVCAVQSADGSSAASGGGDGGVSQDDSSEIESQSSERLKGEVTVRVFQSADGSTAAGGGGGGGGGGSQEDPSEIEYPAPATRVFELETRSPPTASK